MEEVSSQIPSSTPSPINSSNESPIEIISISDYVCPWCYIAKKSLELASAQTQIKINIEWHPYMINPNISANGVDLVEYIGTTFGPEALARFTKKKNPLEMAAKKLGIVFNNNRKMVSPRNAHRLTLWCKEVYPNKVNDLVESIFHAYFVEGQDISKPEVLLNIASQCGISTGEARSILCSTAYLQEVLDKDFAAKSKLRVSGVPYFTINYQNRRRPFNFCGAQPPEVMREYLQEASQTI